MDLMRLILLLLSAASSFYCLPSRTLNDRSTELAWQAWLLVDDQNQYRQQHDPADGILRRRITPKSVFIAPTFSPESLPACADGYRPDSMGRCIKIIKLDEAAHLDFLLQKLNEKFGGFEEEGDDEGEEEGSDEDERTTKGPFQLNIPLSEMETNINDEDIAIIVAPTNNVAGLDKIDKVKRTQSNAASAESEDSNSSSNNSLLLSVLGIPHSNTKPMTESTTTTTTTETSTTPPSTTLPSTVMSTEQAPATTWNQSDQTQTPTTLNHETVSTTTTLPPQTSTLAVETTETTLELSSLSTLPGSTDAIDTTTALPQPQQLVMEHTTNVEDGLHALFYLEPKNSTAVDVDAAVDSGVNKAPLIAVATTAGGSSFVKFPDDKEYPNTKDYIRFPLQAEGMYNHRSRDKHMSFWRTVPANGRAGQSLSHRDDSHGNPEPIYRQLESGELSYLFGNTRGRRNR